MDAPTDAGGAALCATIALFMTRGDAWPRAAVGHALRMLNTSTLTPIALHESWV